jgi:hypothetical protein
MIPTCGEDGGESHPHHPHEGSATPDEAFE